MRNLWNDGSESRLPSKLPVNYDTKELNPDLFEERRTPGSEDRPYDRQGLLDLTNPPAGMGTDPSFLNNDRQLFEVRSQMSLITEQINKIGSAFNELTKSSNNKLDRFQQFLVRLEERHNALVDDSNQKLSTLNHRLSERGSIDQKVQEMVDRHNNVIHNFEVRLGQVQKMLAEKEAQFSAAQIALTDAKLEIARLKRL